MTSDGSNSTMVAPGEDEYFYLYRSAKDQYCNTIHYPLISRISYAWTCFLGFTVTVLVGRLV